MIIEMICLYCNSGDVRKSLTVQFWSSMLYPACSDHEFSVVISVIPFYYLFWTIFGKKMNFDQMTERSPVIWREEGVYKNLETFSFHHRMISDPNESPSDILSDKVLKIILSPDLSFLRCELDTPYQFDITGAHLGGGGIHPLPSKRKVSLNRLFDPKMHH